MIRTKKDLDFYIKADRIMAGLPATPSFMELVKTMFFHFLGVYSIMEYMRCMRFVAYKQNAKPKRFSPMWFRCILATIKFNKYGQRFGFTIGPNSFGYGLLIPHYGTIVVNEGARIGNYAVMHTSTCIGGSDKMIGDFFYLSTGSQVMGSNVVIGNNVTVASNSLVNKSFEHNLLLVGAPANVSKEDYPSWVERDGDKFAKRIELIEKLKDSI